MRNSIKHKNVFEKIKKNSKKLYYHQYKLSKFQMDIKKNMDYYERNSWEE